MNPPWTMEPCLQTDPSLYTYSARLVLHCDLPSPWAARGDLMKIYVSISTRPLAVIVAFILFQTQLAFAAGCDLPMFSGARLFPSVTGSQMLATGDFNHDGFIDLAVANGPGGIISILLGNGDGTFLPSVNYFAGGFASWIGVADFNGDGNPDVAVNAGGGAVRRLGTGAGRVPAPNPIAHC